MRQKNYAHQGSYRGVSCERRSVLQTVRPRRFRYPPSPPSPVEFVSDMEQLFVCGRASMVLPSQLKLMRPLSHLQHARSRPVPS